MRILLQAQLGGKLVTVTSRSVGGNNRPPKPAIAQGLRLAVVVQAVFQLRSCRLLPSCRLFDDHKWCCDSSARDRADGARCPAHDGGDALSERNVGIRQRLSGHKTLADELDDAGTFGELAMMEAVAGLQVLDGRPFDMELLARAVIGGGVFGIERHADHRRQVEADCRVKPGHAGRDVGAPVVEGYVRYLAVLIVTDRNVDQKAGLPMEP